MHSQIKKTGFQIQDLHLHYPQKKQMVHAINGMSLRIDRGECVAITGPSGCGKSSLLALLGGLQRPNSGDIVFDEQSLLTMSDKQLSNFRAESIGFVFQQFCLLPHLSLLDNVLLGVDHLPRAQFEKRARFLLSRVNLESEMLRFPHEVSGGQAQRAAIARAMLRQPHFILADEPTGALDDDTAHMILNLLLELTSEGCGLIVVTHSEAIASRLPRRIRLSAGKVIEDLQQEQRAVA
jgi:putative ABC transport system ATP-binding protein